MIAELILQKIQERKAVHEKDYDDFLEIENVTADVLYPIAARIDELEQVEEIVKQCIAAGEDDGK